MIKLALKLATDYIHLHTILITSLRYILMSFAELMDVPVPVTRLRSPAASHSALPFLFKAAPLCRM